MSSNVSRSPSSGADPTTPDEREDRYPPIESQDLTPEQAGAVRAITQGPRGAFGGPFVPMLRSPGLLHTLQAVGEHLRYRSLVDHRVVEFAILLVAHRWRQRFEWWAHVPLALDAGIDRTVVEEIARGERPSVMDPALEAVWDLYRELDTTAVVSDATFVAARAAVGEAGVVEVVATFGYYTTLAMIMNMAQTPAPRRPPVVALPET